jgi:hypothetical protein
MILNDIDTEVSSVKEMMPELTILDVGATDSRFTELFLGNFIGNVSLRKEKSD